jgi:hypothetical protein
LLIDLPSKKEHALFLGILPDLCCVMQLDLPQKGTRPTTIITTIQTT